MRTIETILGYVPIILMLGGAILYFLPANWVELPVETATLGTALFALGGVLLYAGWYDRFDTESDTTGDDTTYRFDVDSDTIAEDATSHAPTQTTGYLATVGTYGPWILVTIGAALSWGQIRNPDRVGLIDRAPLELPWGEQPVIGFVFILSGLALFVLIHIAIPYFNGD
ncbi:hypothetical protein [Salinigranum halophilum]|jgi:hypothetical protein|uniref:hypothetical protein n=1 Tax=Salinigranum halophilum TaxID=2565931 RepID=UPI00115F25FB|nr:hypothetical protein [Salinigranum halophilum]